MCSYPPKVPRELANVTARPLSMNLERSWLLGEVPKDWKEAHVSLIFKKGENEDLGSCQPVSSTIFQDKLRKGRLDKLKLRWTEN